MHIDGPGVERWAADLGPFLAPAPVDFEATLTLQRGPPRDLPGELSHRRHDLAFAMTAGRGRAIVRDDHPGGLLALLELAVAAALPDGLLLHAAAGVHHGRAWLMPGPSGTGKSTAARAGAFDRVLTDERAIVRRHPDGWRAYGTPWWSTGRTLPLDASSAPVGGIIGLHHGGPWQRPWPPDAAAAALVESAALYTTDPTRRRETFALACDLAAATPAIELAFRPGEDFTRRLPPHSETDTPSGVSSG